MAVGWEPPTQVHPPCRPLHLGAPVFRQSRLRRRSRSPNSLPIEIWSSCSLIVCIVVSASPKPARTFANPCRNFAVHSIKPDRCCKITPHFELARRQPDFQVDPVAATSQTDTVDCNTSESHWPRHHRQFSGPIPCLCHRSSMRLHEMRAVGDPLELAPMKSPRHQPFSPIQVQFSDNAVWCPDTPVKHLRRFLYGNPVRQERGSRR